MLVRVKVFPNSKEEKIIFKNENVFDIYVREKSQAGKANQAVFEALSSFLKIPTGKIRLIKGARQRNKIFEIKENTPEPREK